MEEDEERKPLKDVEVPSDQEYFSITLNFLAK